MSAIVSRITQVPVDGRQSQTALTVARGACCCRMASHV
jgi:hypothetical protein